MRLDERLEKNVEEKEKKKKKNYDDEETLMYMERQSQGFINDRKSVFSGFGDEGLNNAPSIFDRQAVFTSKKEEDI